MSLKVIVSGGQTGVDRAALDAALASGFPCGGWCPSDRKAEDGKIDPKYPLVAMAKGGYKARTQQNVIDSDGTLIIYFSALKGGTDLTHRCCIAKNKPYQLIDATEISAERAAVLAIEFIERCAVTQLNVAGPRESSERSVQICLPNDESSYRASQSRSGSELVVRVLCGSARFFFETLSSRLIDSQRGEFRVAKKLIRSFKAPLPELSGTS